MNKVLVSVVVIAAILIGGFYAFNNYIYQEKQNDDGVSSYMNGTYKISGETVKLTDGLYEAEITPGSVSKYQVRYFGNEARGDLNGDGIEDVTFLVTQNTGGTGTFYHVVAAVATSSGYVGTDSVLLGDRISPQTTEIRDGKLIVNYADRKPGEAFTAQPSVGKSIVLLLDRQSMQFGEVAQNFEGEADPSAMSLGMKKWTWINATSGDGTKLVPKQAGKFTLSFTNDGRFSATTDCNQMGGIYTVDGKTITFDSMYSTKMYCEGSQEGDFAALLGKANSYSFTSKGELVIGLKSDSGSMIFK